MSSSVPVEGPEIRLLGPLEVRIDNRLVNLGGRRQRSVLAILALHVNHVVSTANLVDGVWGDDGLNRPSNSLQVYIYNLRRLLEPGRKRSDPYRIIVSKEPGYALSLTPDRVDSARFELAVAAARGLKKRGEVRGAIDNYLAADCCWGGAALADLVYEPFAGTEANRLETLRLDALEERIDLQLQLGLHGEVLGELEVLVNEHPFREDLRAQLMLSLYRCQRQTDALRIFDQGRRLLVDELGLEPGSRLAELQASILRHDPDLDWFHDGGDPSGPSGRGGPSDSRSSTGLGIPAPLPRALGSLIGRRDEIEEVVRTVSSSPVTTLVGVAGCGKSRLAYAAAKELGSHFSDGVFVVDLTAVTDAKEVEARVCDELGIAGGTDLPGQRIAAALEGRKALLVIDNCEHVLDAIASLAVNVVNSAPMSSLLVTSREAVQIPGETVRAVQPLSIPPQAPIDPDRGMGFESVELFVDRARLVSPTFALSAANTGAVVDLVTYLDGLPLAIELVAARSRTLTPQELSLRLRDRLKVLDLSQRSPTGRQRTLRGTIDWSFGLLAEEEQEALWQLSVLAGGWTMEAAERVVTPTDPTSDVADLVDRLVGKSLVTSRLGNSGRRFRMPEVIREYALEKLEESGDRNQVDERFTQWGVDYARSCATDLIGRRSATSLAMIEIERTNLLRTTSLLLEQRNTADGLMMIEILVEFWIRRGRWSEARVWLIRGISAVHSHVEPTTDDVAARLMLALASVCSELGDDQIAQQWAADAREIFSSHGLTIEAASATSVLSHTYRAAGDLDTAETLARSALEQYRRSESARGEAIARTRPGRTCSPAGR